MRAAQQRAQPTRDAYAAQVAHADGLRRAGAHDEALRAFHALALTYPQRSDALNNLAAMLQATGHPTHALQAVMRALELDGANVSALQNSAEILKDFGDWDTVRATYDAALELRPASAELRFARALHLLTLGIWEEGWREHEQRSRVPGLPLRRTVLRSPVWDGAPLNGRHILLDHEQGLGDQIMFARFATDVAERGGRVTIRCSASLESMCAQIRGVSTVSCEGTAVPSHDVHASLMSLPALLGARAPASLSGVPYLQTSGECPAAIRDAFTRDKLNVGLVWSGNRQHRNDARRSIAPALLAPLLNTGGVAFTTLHGGDTHMALPDELRGCVTDLGASLQSFNDTAHVLMQLDLLVTVDTAIAHLAGALGVPTLLLLPFVPDWRWMVDRTDTPWYRSLSLIRQPALFDWHSVIDAACARVVELRDAA